MSYAESFLSYADDQGQVDLDIAAQLLEEHGTTFEELRAESYKDAPTDAEALLSWLGY